MPEVTQQFNGKAELEHRSLDCRLPVGIVQLGNSTSKALRSTGEAALKLAHGLPQLRLGASREAEPTEARHLGREGSLPLSEATSTWALG